MNKNTIEAIDLSDAAARLLAQGDLTVGASKLVDVFTYKALRLLSEEPGETLTGTAKTCDLPAVLKLLGIDTSLRGKEITFRITPTRDTNTVNVTATIN